MNCEVEYCIYNRKSKCIFDETSINSLGMCDGCIIVALDSNFLEAEKERQMQKLEGQWLTNRMNDRQ